MKKIIACLLSITVLFSTYTLPVLAEDGDNSEGNITGEGTIELGDDTNSLIEVDYSSTFHWYVTGDTAPNIEATTQTIINQSTKTNIQVTLESFTQTNAVTISGLTLNLTGDLLETNINIGKNIVGFENTENVPYTNLLSPGDTWRYSFDGTYTGQITSQTLVPQYKMLLRFSVESVTAP